MRCCLSLDFGNIYRAVGSDSYGVLRCSCSLNLSNEDCAVGSNRDWVLCRCLSLDLSNIDGTVRHRCHGRCFESCCFRDELRAAKRSGCGDWLWCLSGCGSRGNRIWNFGTGSRLCNEHGVVLSDCFGSQRFCYQDGIVLSFRCRDRIWSRRFGNELCAADRLCRGDWLRRNIN